MNHPSYYATLNPDKVAYVMADTGESLTYGQLDDASNRGAHALRSAGIGPGGHVALLVENSLAFFEICWSAQRSGIYYTAISTHLKAPEVAYIIKDCGATLLYITARLLDGVLGEIRATTPDVRIVTVDERVPGFEFMPDLVAQQPATPIADECFGRDLLYSSGTTGRPKGVNVTFVREPIATVTSLLVVIGQQMCGMGTDTVYLSPAPLYHAAPLRFTMLCCSLGGTAVIMRKFDAETYLRLVQEHRVTLTQVVPTMFVRMLKLPAEVRASYDVSSLRGAIHAAAPCPQDVKQAMIDWWGPILIEYYAGTEANGVTIIDSHEWLTHPGSVGRSRVGRIEILGEDREGPSLPPGQVGDVFFADGPAFSYLNDTEKTMSAHNSKGWSTLGDVGYLDEEGYLYLTDRKSYMIITGGVNVYPQETENVLIAHPAVFDVAVFGVPNEEMGEEVKAVVQLAPGVTPSKDLKTELIAYCRAHLSAIKSPKTVDFVDDMPRTPTGKLVKRHLRDRYWPQPKPTLAAT